MNPLPLIVNSESKKTRKFLIFAFTSIVVLIILSTGIGLRHLSSVQKGVNQLIDTQNTQIELMNKMRFISQAQFNKLQTLIAAEEVSVQKDLVSEFHHFQDVFQNTRAMLMKTDLTEEERTLLALQKEMVRKVQSSETSIIDLIEQHQQGLNVQALKLLVSDTVPLQNENMSLMDQFILYQNHQYQELKTDSQNKVNEVRQTILAYISITILLIVVLAILAIQRFSRLMNQLMQPDAESQLNIDEQLLSEYRMVEQNTHSDEYVAGHDSLTGLPNRLLFTELLAQEIKKANRNLYQLAILYMNLDNFKAIMDKHGADISDALIINVQKRLQSSLRRADLIARLGGDEFAICYSNTKDIEDIKILCQIIVDKINQPMFLGQHQCHIGISIGVALYPKHGNDCCTLLNVAETAMHKVKEQGKNNFIIGD